ncbi:MAG TPA: CDP-alcohol phosphatidyltransferase family protein [Polyangiaceae bacterium]|nr:CDP-alcohol phosphatidyltransferase family protein [Polyangiaceae bacterium]
MTMLDLQEKALLGLFLALPALILGAYAVRVATAGRALDARVQRESSTVLLGRFPIEAFHWALRGVGRKVSRTGVSPDTLTLISLLISAASLPLAAIGRLPAAGACLLFGSAFDALDGIVARERGLSSDAGEVLDAVVDRYADAAPLLGLAIFYRASLPALLVVLFALLGSLLVSYVRAKSEAMSLSLPGGLMRRHERIAYLTAGLLLGPVLPSAQIASLPLAMPLSLLAVTVVALVSNLAAVQLTRAARAALVELGRGPRGRA